MNKQSLFTSTKHAFWMLLPVTAFLMSSCYWGSDDNAVQPTTPETPEETPVVEQSVLTLPSEANISVSDIELLGDGQDITIASDGTFESDASTFVAFHNNEIVHITFGCDYEPSSLNSMETAVSLLLPIIPYAVTDMESEKFWFLKQMIGFLEPTRKLAEAIDKSIVQYGYLNMDAISKEYEAAVEELKTRMGLNEASQARNMQSAGQRAMTRTESPHYPYFTNYQYDNPDRIEGDGFTITIDHRSVKEKDGKKYRNCKFTLYNQNRWVYTSFTKAYKKENDNFARLTPGFTDTFTHLVKPMNVSAFMNWGVLSDLATKPKENLKTLKKFFEKLEEGIDEEDPEYRIISLYKDRWEVFRNIGRAWRGEETKITTFDKIILKDVEFSFYDNNEHLMIMGPGINSELKLFNFIKIFFQPLIKMILGEITKSKDYDDSSDEDQFLLDFIELLFSDVNAEFTYKILATISDPNNSWSDKLEVIPDLLEKFVNYIVDEALKTGSEYFYENVFGFKERGVDDPTIKAIFKVYKTSLVLGDIYLLSKDFGYEGHGFEMTQGFEQFEPDPICTPAEAIDLGLTSGTLWASYNVGATSTTESGDTFAWGEIEPKDLEKLLGDTFTDYELWNTYKWCSDGNYQTVTKYHSIDNKTILDLEDDAAHYKWGGSWRMPTYDELKELLDECDSEWIPNHGVSGWWLTGPNGNKIFLPSGLYWTSELAAQNKAFVLKATINGLSRSADVRPWTNRVRPVYVKE